MNKTQNLNEVFAKIREALTALPGLTGAVVYVSVEPFALKTLQSANQELVAEDDTLILGQGRILLNVTGPEPETEPDTSV